MAGEPMGAGPELHRGIGFALGGLLNLDSDRKTPSDSVRQTHQHMHRLFGGIYFREADLQRAN